MYFVSRRNVAPTARAQLTSGAIAVQVLVLLRTDFEDLRSTHPAINSILAERVSKMRYDEMRFFASSCQKFGQVRPYLRCISAAARAYTSRISVVSSALALQAVTRDELTEIARLLTTVRFRRGADLARAEHPPQAIYFIFAGTCEVRHVDGKTEEHSVGTVLFAKVCRSPRRRTHPNPTRDRASRSARRNS